MRSVLNAAVSATEYVACGDGFCLWDGACVTNNDKLGLRGDYAGRGTMSRAQIEPLRLAALENVGEDKLLVSGMIREK